MVFLIEVFIFLIAALAVVPILNRLGLSSVIGHLVAGIVIGPSGFAMIDNAEDILHFAEIGVVLLLFIIGLELQPRRLWVMRKAVFGMGTLQVLLTTVALTLALYLIGVGFAPALLLGFSLALSSTAFVLQLLAEKKQLNHAHGRAAFGVLLFQDIAVIPVIAYLSIAGCGGDHGAINPVAIGAVLGGLVLARFVLRPLLKIVAETGVHELFIAASLAIVTGAALGMYAAGLSMGLGAFIAGMLVADSEYRHQMETDVMPFKGLLLGLFFIAVGMSADLGLLLESPLLIIGLTLGLIVIKALVMYPIALWNGLDSTERLKTAVVLSQGGEFAFVLLTVALAGGLVSAHYTGIAVLVVTLSMASTPFLMMAIERFTAERDDERDFDAMADSTGGIIIAGFGRFGQIVGRVLNMQQIPFTALDSNPGQIEFVRSYGNDVYYGDATRLDLLQNAGVKDASALIIALNDVEDSIHIAEMIRETCPDVKLFARARNRQHEIKLREVGVHVIMRDTLLSSLAITQSLLESLGRDDAEDIIHAFKEHDEETLQRQAAVIHDENAFRQTTMDAADELKQLFADDQDTELPDDTQQI